MSSLLAKVNSANSPLSGALVEDAGLTFLGRAAVAPIACTPAAPIVGVVTGVIQAINNCDEIQCESCSDSSLCDALTIITT